MHLHEVERALTVLGGAPIGEVPALRNRPLKEVLGKTTMTPANRKRFVIEFLKPELRRNGHNYWPYQIRRMTLRQVCDLMPRGAP